MRTLTRFLADESGAMLLEFSLSIWTLFLTTFLIFEFCMAVYTYSVLSNAAREGVRYGIVHGTDSGRCSGPGAGCGDPSGANVTASVRSYASLTFHDIRGMTVTPFLARRERNPIEPGGGHDQVLVHRVSDSARLQSAHHAGDVRGRIVF